jgi:hypothetical protein
MNSSVKALPKREAASAEKRLACPGGFEPRYRRERKSERLPVVPSRFDCLGGARRPHLAGAWPVFEGFRFQRAGRLA